MSSRETDLSSNSRAVEAGAWFTRIRRPLTNNYASRSSKHYCWARYFEIQVEQHKLTESEWKAHALAFLVFYSSFLDLLGAGEQPCFFFFFYLIFRSINMQAYHSTKADWHATSFLLYRFQIYNRISVRMQQVIHVDRVLLVSSSVCVRISRKDKWREKLRRKQKEMLHNRRQSELVLKFVSFRFFLRLLFARTKWYRTIENATTTGSPSFEIKGFRFLEMKKAKHAGGQTEKVRVEGEEIHGNRMAR